MAEASDTSDTTKKDVLLAALEASLGVVATACKRANIARSTHYKWLQEDVDYKAAVEEIAEVSLDFGESQLHKLMNGYTQPDTKIFLNSDTKKPIEVPVIKHIGPDATSVIFFLKTKGKARGFVPSRAVDVTSGGKPLGERQLTDEDLLRIAAGGR